MPGSPRFQDAHTFENGESNACITVTLETECDLFSAAHLGSYNPVNACENYLADRGNSLFENPTNTYSFNVAARARFVVIVNQVFATDFCPYRFTVTNTVTPDARRFHRLRKPQQPSGLSGWATAGSTQSS